MIKWRYYMNRNMRTRTFGHTHPTMTQISLRIRAVWSEFSLSASRNFASLTTQWKQIRPIEILIRLRECAAELNLCWEHMSKCTFFFFLFLFCFVVVVVCCSFFFCIFFICDSYVWRQSKHYTAVLFSVCLFIEDASISAINLLCPIISNLTACRRI